MVSNNKAQLLSKMATGDEHGENSTYFDGLKAYEDNPYHHTNNPNGIIQMGLAEYPLCHDLVQDWLLNNPQASIFQDYHGLPEFRNAMANSMAEARGNSVKFNPDRIVISDGATAAHESVVVCLADPEDAFLVPTPYYPGFDFNLRWRTGVQIIPVICDSSNDFKLTREALESAYKKAIEEGINVKGLIINNPSNSLGTLLVRDTLTSLVSFINEKNIHLVCDEIYAAAVFSGQLDFVSIAEVIENVECNKDLIHLVFSLSKDMGFHGLRFGIIYSYNDTVVSRARKMSSLGRVLSQSLHMITAMKSDNEFVDKFNSESAKRLATRYNFFTGGLGLVGIDCLKSNAGLFLWMDLHQLLKEQTLEAEMSLWRVLIQEVKLHVSPGSLYHCPNPGRFRVCFGNMDNLTVKIALSRIRTFIRKIQEPTRPKSLRLIFDDDHDDNNDGGRRNNPNGEGGGNEDKDGRRGSGGTEIMRNKFDLKGEGVFGFGYIYHSGNENVGQLQCKLLVPSSASNRFLNHQINTTI